VSLGYAGQSIDLTTAAQTSPAVPARHARLLDALARERCAAALLVGPQHAAHLAGYSRVYSGPLALLILADGRSTLLAPRYEVDAATAHARVDGVEGYGGEGFGLDLTANTKLAEAAAELLPAGRIAVASEVPGVAEAALAISGREWLDFAPTIGALRLIKDADECELIAHAYALSLAGQAAVEQAAQPDAREIDLFTAAYARAQTDAGAPIEFGGDLLVGERSALVCGPVAVPGERRAQVGDVVVSDLSVRHRGYWGDTARTFIVGDNSDAERAREFITGVLGAAAAEMRPDVAACEIFARMRAAIIDRYPDGSFPHHGGHGVGVTVFEDPHLIPADETLLRAGMVIAVEPGVYLPGRFGVRMENVYLVTDEGGKDLLSTQSG
jgi:Xaa-Pro dipeptidase